MELTRHFGGAPHPSISFFELTRHFRQSVCGIAHCLVPHFVILPLSIRSRYRSSTNPIINCDPVQESFASTPDPCSPIGWQVADTPFFKHCRTEETRYELRYLRRCCRCGSTVKAAAHIEPRTGIASVPCKVLPSRFGQQPHQIVHSAGPHCAHRRGRVGFVPCFATARSDVSWGSSGIVYEMYSQ